MTDVVKLHRFIVCVMLVGLSIRNENVACVEIKFEAEHMFGNVSSIVQRSSASGNKSVHLDSGQSLYMDICLSTPTEIFGIEVIYSNDGDSDRIGISFGNIELGEVDTLRFTNGGQGWSKFRASHDTLPPATITGRQALKLTVLNSDSYGVEIDFIKFNLNSSQSLPSLKCEAFCFSDIKYTNDKSFVSPHTAGRAEQRSVKTLCAEEDNVNVPIFHDDPRKFIVTAHMPKYSSFLNNRGPDWENCEFYQPFWTFNNIHLVGSRTTHMGNAQLTMSLSGNLLMGSTRIAMMEVDFVLGNVSLGSTESVVGTRTILSGLKLSGSVSFQFQYLDRYDTWSATQVKTVKQGDTSVEFETPDHSFREGDGNKIRIEVFTERTDAQDVTIGEMTMHMRQLAPDKSSTLYKDESTIIEGVDIDLWWRVNETMTVTVDNKTFSDVDYIRIYQRLPWSRSDIAQVFVLYQDGNIRLLPLTPHGLDWIPFGSSVIIGQTDPMSPRPSAPIKHLEIDPILLKITVWYTDGSVVPLELQSTGPETKLQVSNSHFVGDLHSHPFFTFRSMYVTYGNSDVDHISVDGGDAVTVTDQWSSLYGNFFAFFRQCISTHNTQSPDITLDILS